MSKGFVITQTGKKLLAELVATRQELNITRVMVGKGELPQGQSPEQFADLIEPVTQATSTIPIVKNGVISFIVEYRNDLNGGLQEGFWLKEFGVFAKDGENEILLYYASLGEYPQYVEAYENGKVNIKKYPVSILVTDDIKVNIAYAALAFVTEERMKEFVEIEALPYLEGVLAESENGILAELEKKANIETVEQALDTKADMEVVQIALEQKANAQEVQIALDKKADKETVTEELAKKADAEMVAEELAKKADAETMQQALDQKANEMEMFTELGKKADKEDVIQQLAGKADKEEVKTELDKKVDKEEIEEILQQQIDSTNIVLELDKKADKEMVAEELAKKANAEIMQEELNKKADAEIVTEELAKKANSETMQTELDKKADIATMTEELEGKANVSHTHNANDITEGTIRSNIKICNITNNTDCSMAGHNINFGNGGDNVTLGSNGIAIGHKSIAGAKEILYVKSKESNRIWFKTRVQNFESIFQKLTVNATVFVEFSRKNSNSGITYKKLKILEIDNTEYSITVEEFPENYAIGAIIIVNTGYQSTYETDMVIGYQSIVKGKNSNVPACALGSNLFSDSSNSLIVGSNITNIGNINTASGNAIVHYGSYIISLGDNIIAIPSNNKCVICKKFENNIIYIDSVNTNIDSYTVGKTIYCMFNNMKGLITTHTILSINKTNNTITVDDSDGFVYNGRFIMILTNGLYSAHSNNIGYSIINIGAYSTGIGTCITILQDYQTAIGKYNKSNSDGLFVIGNGSSESARSNCFRVQASGGVFANASYNSTGADYAEYFEWLDSNKYNEDRIGHFVTLVGDKIKIANSDDNYILGIISGNASVIGDSYEDQWNNMFKRDIYDRPIMEEVEIPEKKEIREIIKEHIFDKDGNEIEQEKVYEEVVVEEAHIEIRQKLNPNYDPEQEYIPRSQRPEWGIVGMLGKMVAIDDGSCEENGWCKVGEGGIATISEQKTRFRVMKRLDQNHIKIFIL